MASIRKPRMTAKGKVWDVDYRDPVTGKGRMKTFSTLTLAKTGKAQIETELARGEYLDRQQGQQTFAVFATDWLSLHQVRPATLQKLTSLLGNHIVPYFGPVSLVRIASGTSAPSLSIWTARCSRQPPSRAWSRTSSRSCTPLWRPGHRQDPGAGAAPAAGEPCG